MSSPQPGEPGPANVSRVREWGGGDINAVQVVRACQEE
jgi:hypothetical protein